MKALVVYRSKYGAAAECARRISERLNAECDVVDLKSETPDPAQYDIVVIGGAIYSGKILRGVRRFCSKFMGVLQEKTVGIYISCLYADDKAREELEGNYPDWLKAHSVAMEWFGGNAVLDNMSSIDRFLYAKVAGVSEDVRAIRDDRIADFCDKIQKATTN